MPTPIKRIILLLLLLILSGTGGRVGAQVKAYDTYPWIVEANTNLNVRAKWGTDYEKLGTVQSEVTPEMRRERNRPANRFFFSGFLSSLWKVIKTLLVIFIILIAISYKEEVLRLVMTIVMCTLIGRWTTGLIFHNVDWGTNIGFVLGIILSVRKLVEETSFGGGVANQFLGTVYYIISFPIFLLNQAQYFLSAPWRYFFKSDWPAESNKKAIRVTLDVLQVIMYILITPLRFYNSVLYNIFVHGLSEMYDLVYEVFVPCDWDEGKGDFWQWLLYFPVRLVKYPIYHGTVMLLECLVWTVIEILIPTVTMYHGTNLEAAESICGSADRNAYLKRHRDWRAECFTTGMASWGGIGVYFTSKRWVARSYSLRALGSDADVPVYIAVRVSLGRIVNYSLAPHFVYRQTGEGGKHSLLNAFGMQNHYITGEWWNVGGGYWEYCMFDWQKKYNFPWRIRPLYVFNCEKNSIQHIPGGMAHWSFRTNH